MDVGHAQERLSGLFINASTAPDGSLAVWLLYPALLLVGLLTLLFGILLWNRILRKRADRGAIEIDTVHAQYRKLFENSISAVSICRIIFDETGRPVDYVITHANPAFDRHTVLKRSEILGKRMTEIYSGFEKCGLIERYGRVAMSGEPDVFEFYFDSVRRHYQIQVFQVDPGRCAVVFADISEQKRFEACRKVQLEVSRVLHEVQTVPELLNRLPGLLSDLPTVSGGGLYLSDHSGQAFLLKAHWGLPAEFIAAVERVEADSENGRQVMAGRRILRFHLRTAWTDASLAAPLEHSYIRAFRADGHMAWSSPVFFESPSTA